MAVDSAQGPYLRSVGLPRVSTALEFDFPGSAKFLSLTTQGDPVTRVGLRRVSQRVVFDSKGCDTYKS